MRRRLLLVLLLFVLLPIPAMAGISIFGKKAPKPTPQERVPELIKIIKMDGDETKRTDAVEELKQYDPMQFPEIMPVLVDALLNDKKAGVRAEAAHSIGKIRPVSQMAGRALEKALADDSSMRVRIQCRSSILSYQWAGWRSNGKKDDVLLAGKEPPLADPPGKGPLLPPPTIMPARLTPTADGPSLPPINTQPYIPSPAPNPQPGPATNTQPYQSPAAPGSQLGPDLN